MAKFSTGLRNGMLGDMGAKTQLDLGFLQIYAGTAPASADDVVGGTLLATLTDDGGGNGLTFEMPVGAVLSKTAAQIWKTDGIVTTGTASYFRFVSATDTGAASTTEPRIQGLIGTVASDMNVSNTLFTAADPFTLNFFSVALPTSA